MRRIPNGAVNWFRDLPSVPKLVLVGLVLVALLVLLSPVVRVVAIVAFIVSIAVLIVRGAQRKPIRMWGIATLTSLVLFFVFGGISGAFYGNGVLGSNGSGGSGDSAEGVSSDSSSANQFADVPQIDPSDTDALYRMGPVLAGTPKYEVYEVQYPAPNASLWIGLRTTFETCRDDMRALMEDVDTQTRRFDSIEIMVFNLNPLEGFEEGDIIHGFAGVGEASGLASAAGQSSDPGSKYTDHYQEGNYEYGFSTPYCYP